MPNPLPQESPAHFRLFHRSAFPLKHESHDWKYLLHPLHALSCKRHPYRKTSQQNCLLSLPLQTPQLPFVSQSYCGWIRYNPNHPTSSDVHQKSWHWLLLLLEVPFHTVPLIPLLLFLLHSLLFALMITEALVSSDNYKFSR